MALSLHRLLPSLRSLRYTCHSFSLRVPRWYLVRGKINEAMEVMRVIAKSNGKHLPDGVVLGLDEETNENSTDTESYKEELSTKQAISGSLIDVIRSPITRFRLFLAVVINFLCSVVYYGLSLNVVNLETNLYLSVLLNAVAEMPAYTLTAVLLDSNGIWKVVRMVCGVLGIFGMAGTYNLLFIYTTELFPTVVRNAALGCATQAAQMGAILAPFVVVLGKVLPFAVFGACGISGGILAFYLPETLNQPLYDTMTGMEDAEKALKE
ncbi:Organic cation/carnitine transporter 4 [Vitis vinifera]|uniref:Organic cation/carnitine transporter 4 n=1 Tax=Vitis vinifera TaxID=29760 RepID=A0A438DP75_VITVI|nr:Organic cation/carnitine transporter 4 [Vitis vinifera]